MSKRHIEAVEDYTTTCLVFFWANLFWVMIVVWVTLGMPVVLVLAYALDRLIARMGRRAQPRART